MKKIKIINIIFIALIMAGCNQTRPAMISNADDKQTLYVLPDGTMEYKGRVMADDDVVIYQDGFGGERAAVKLYFPLYSHAWRDTITVERVFTDLPIAKQDVDLSGEDKTTIQ